MSYNYEKWINIVDEDVRLHIGSLCHELNVSPILQGYYIEDNPYTGNVGPGPIFESLYAYKEKVPDTMFIDHVRYFFELAKEEQTYVATVHFYERSKGIIEFSIEETYAKSKMKGEIPLKDDFEPFKEIVIKKFNLNGVD